MIEKYCRWDRDIFKESKAEKEGYRFDYNIYFSRERWNLFMKRKLLSGILALTVMFSFSSGISVSAATLESAPENIMSENNRQMEFLQISDEEVPVAEVPETELNVADRSYTGEDLSLSGIMPYSENDDVSNTDPDYAYFVENGNAYQGNIENEEEFRWYCFEITEKSKVTVFLQMAETLDTDLYMFSLDTETFSLNLVGGSATEGLGVSEYYADVLEPGIYYFASAGYEGTGSFAFAFFQSSQDAGYEVNDTSSTATNISVGSSAIGVIDSPLDIDYYKISVSKGYIMNYSISTTDNYSLLFAGKSGSNAAIYTVGDEDNTVLIMPGTYYFAVLSENNTYSATSTYTVNFRKVYELSSDSSANVIGICDEAGIVFQTNSSGSVYYVNGNPIDISYSYSNSSSNSAGSQSYNISITDRDNVYAYLGDDALAPAAIYYMNSTRPAMNVSSRAALELTFYSDSNFYSVHCVCTGAYKENNLWQDFKAVTVIIDPSTGKLIDIESFNYYYDYAVGSNSLTFTRRYPSMTLYRYGN